MWLLALTMTTTYACRAMVLLWAQAQQGPRTGLPALLEYSPALAINRNKQHHTLCFALAIDPYCCFLLYFV